MAVGVGTLLGAFLGSEIGKSLDRKIAGIRAQLDEAGRLRAELDEVI